MRRPGLGLGAVLLSGLAVALLPPASLLWRSWPWRVAVDGHSMEPTLRAGDWLLVDPQAYRRRNPQAGALVVVRDPRQPERWLVKRVTSVDRDARLSLAGDHPAHASEALPPVEPDLVVGRPWLRYWPPDRVGRLA
jgi:nickel-type superoxide dismutase maturation protease